MLINDTIKKTLIEIAAESVKYGNSTESQRKYIIRLLGIFNKHLNEEEKIYFIAFILDMIHYRTIATDPENVLTMHNIKFRYLFLVLLFLFVFVILGVLKLMNLESITMFFEALRLAIGITAN